MKFSVMENIYYVLINIIIVFTYKLFYLQKIYSKLWCYDTAEVSSRVTYTQKKITAKG